MASPQAARGRDALSVVVITRNAGDLLVRCLASVAFAEEVVIVDDESTDDSIERAARELARPPVVLRRRLDGFAAQKQFGVDRASGPWILSLDADEWVSHALRRSIVEFIDQAPSTHGAEVDRLNYFLGRPLVCCGMSPDWVARLFRRGHASFSGRVHEHLAVEGPVARLEGQLLHDSGETLRERTAKSRRYAVLGAEEAIRRGARASVRGALLGAGRMFVLNYVRRSGWRAGRRGFAWCVLQALESGGSQALVARAARARR